MAKTNTKDEFFKMISGAIIREAKARGYKFPSAIIAQAAVESNYGKSVLSKNYYNYFGMKCGKSWRGRSVNMKTKEEFTAGKLTTISDNFRAYNSITEGVKGYFDFINTSRYSNLLNAKSAFEYVAIIKRDGWATASNYVDTVCNVIMLNNLTQYDTANAYTGYNVDAIARDVIAGKYGVGNARKKALAAAGYDYAKVQARVNEMLKAGAK